MVDKTYDDFRPRDWNDVAVNFENILTHTRYHPEEALHG